MNREDPTNHQGNFRHYYHNRKQRHRGAHSTSYKSRGHYKSSWIDNSRNTLFSRSGSGRPKTAIKSGGQHNHHWPLAQSTDQSSRHALPIQLMPPPPPPPEPVHSFEEKFQNNIQQISGSFQKQFIERPDAELVLPSNTEDSEMKEDSNENIPGYHQAAVELHTEELNTRKNAKKMAQRKNQLGNEQRVREICESLWALKEQDRKRVSRQIRQLHNKMLNIEHCDIIHTIVPDVFVKLEVLPEEFVAQISSFLPEDVASSVNDVSYEDFANSSLSNNTQNTRFDMPVHQIQHPPPPPPPPDFPVDEDSLFRHYPNIPKHEHNEFTRSVKCHIRPGRPDSKPPLKIKLKRECSYEDAPNNVNSRFSLQSVPPPEQFIPFNPSQTPPQHQQVMNSNKHQRLIPPAPLSIGPQIPTTRCPQNENRKKHHSESRKIRVIKEAYEVKSHASNRNVSNQNEHRTQLSDVNANGCDKIEDDILFRQNFQLGSPDDDDWNRNILVKSKERVREELAQEEDNAEHALKRCIIIKEENAEVESSLQNGNSEEEEEKTVIGRSIDTDEEELDYNPHSWDEEDDDSSESTQRSIEDVRIDEDMTETVAENVTINLRPLSRDHPIEKAICENVTETITDNATEQFLHLQNNCLNVRLVDTSEQIVENLTNSNEKIETSTENLTTNLSQLPSDSTNINSDDSFDQTVEASTKNLTQLRKDCPNVNLDDTSERTVKDVIISKDPMESVIENVTNNVLQLQKNSTNVRPVDPSKQITEDKANCNDKIEIATTNLHKLPSDCPNEIPDYTSDKTDEDLTISKNVTEIVTDKNVILDDTSEQSTEDVTLGKGVTADVTENVTEKLLHLQTDCSKVDTAEQIVKNVTNCKDKIETATETLTTNLQQSRKDCPNVNFDNTSGQKDKETISKDSMESVIENVTKTLMQLQKDFFKDKTNSKNNMETATTNLHQLPSDCTNVICDDTSDKTNKDLTVSKDVTEAITNNKTKNLLHLQRDCSKDTAEQNVENVTSRNEKMETTTDNLQQLRKDCSNVNFDNTSRQKDKDVTISKDSMASVIENVTKNLLQLQKDFFKGPSLEQFMEDKANSKDKMETATTNLHQLPSDCTNVISDDTSDKTNKDLTISTDVTEAVTNNETKRDFFKGLALQQNMEDKANNTDKMETTLENLPQLPSDCANINADDSFDQSSEDATINTDLTTTVLENVPQKDCPSVRLNDTLEQSIEDVTLSKDVTETVTENKSQFLKGRPKSIIVLEATNDPGLYIIGGLKGNLGSEHMYCKSVTTTEDVGELNKEKQYQIKPELVSEGVQTDDLPVTTAEEDAAPKTNTSPSKTVESDTQLHQSESKRKHSRSKSPSASKHLKSSHYSKSSHRSSSSMSKSDSKTKSSSRSESTRASSSESSRRKSKHEVETKHKKMQTIPNTKDAMTKNVTTNLDNTSEPTINDSMGSVQDNVTKNSLQLQKDCPTATLDDTLEQTSEDVTLFNDMTETVTENVTESMPQSQLLKGCPKSIIVLEATKDPGLYKFGGLKGKLGSEHMYCKNITPTEDVGETKIENINKTKAKPKVVSEGIQTDDLPVSIVEEDAVQKTNTSPSKTVAAETQKSKRKRERSRSKSPSTSKHSKSSHHSSSYCSVSKSDYKNKSWSESTRVSSSRRSHSRHEPRTSHRRTQTDPDETDLGKIRSRFDKYKRKTRALLKQLKVIDKKVDKLLEERRELYTSFEHFVSCSESEEETEVGKRVSVANDTTSQQTTKVQEKCVEKPTKYIIISEGESTSKVNPVLNSDTPSEDLLTKVNIDSLYPNSPPDFSSHSMDMDIFSINFQDTQNKASTIPEELDIQEETFGDDSNSVAESATNEMMTSDLCGVMNISETMPMDILESSDNECLDDSPLKMSCVKLIKYDLEDLARMKQDIEQKPRDHVPLTNNNVKIEDVGTNVETDVNSDFIQEEEVVEENVDEALDFIGWKDSILVIKVVKKFIAAGGDKGNLYLYDTHSGAPIFSTVLCSNAITSIIVYDNGRGARLYVGALDGNLYVFDVVGKRVIRVVSVSAPIQCIEMSWTILYIGSSLGDLIKYSFTNGRISTPINISPGAVLAIRCSMDGARRVVVVASRNSPITIRDASTGLELRTIERVNSLTVLSLVLHNNRIYCGTSQNDVLAFNFHDGKELEFAHNESAGSGVVCMITIRNLLFVGCYNRRIYVYNTTDNSLVTSMSAPKGLLLSLAVIDTKVQLKVFNVRHCHNLLPDCSEWQDDERVNPPDCKTKVFLIKLQRFK